MSQDSLYMHVPLSLLPQACEVAAPWREVLRQLPSLVSEAFLMATVCPPFNAVGAFACVPYGLGGLVFLLCDPPAAHNILTFIFALLGQVAWLALGFFVLDYPLLH